MRTRRISVFYSMVLLLIGSIAAVMSLQYGLGSLSRMQTGYFPFAASIMLVLVSFCLMAEALLSPTQKDEQNDDFDWRSCVFVSLGIIAFGLLVPRVGLLPATAVLTLVAAFANPGRRGLEFAVLTIVITTIIYVVFIIGLRVSVPAVTWRM